jgi:hypothetical protein
LRFDLCKELFPFARSEEAVGLDAVLLLGALKTAAEIAETGLDLAAPNELTSANRQNVNALLTEL